MDSDKSTMKHYEALWNKRGGLIRIKITPVYPMKPWETFEKWIEMLGFIITIPILIPWKKWFEWGYITNCDVNEINHHSVPTKYEDIKKMGILHRGYNGKIWDSTVCWPPTHDMGVSTNQLKHGDIMCWYTMGCDTQVCPILAFHSRTLRCKNTLFPTKRQKTPAQGPSALRHC
jgi:hypothetical protein